MGRKPTKNLNLPKGMRARQQKSGRIYYYYDTGGIPRCEIPLGNDYVAAIKKWAELEADQSQPHITLITFKYVAERYCREILPTKAYRTQRDNINELTKLYAFFDNPPAPLEQIQSIHIRQYLDWRHTETKNKAIEENKRRIQAGKKPLALSGQEGKIRANREKALFSHIWNKAKEWGLTDKSNPCQGVKGFQETGRSVYVDDKTYHAVWQAADQATRDAMDLAYLTGQRPADILKLDERHIINDELHIRQNKTGVQLRIQIMGELAHLLARIKARKTTYKLRSTQLIVDETGYPISPLALRSRFDKARERAGIDKALFQFRDLRAKAGTDKEDREGMEAAKNQLGHTSESMTRHYVRHRQGKRVTPTK